MAELVDEPAIRSWMTKKERELRRNAKALLVKAAELGRLPGRELRKVKIFPQGSSSVVFKITTENGISVAKIPTRWRSVSREAYALKRWKTEAGVNVPEVISIFPADKQLEISILNLEYINGVTSDEIIDKTVEAPDFWGKVGIELAKLHRVTGTGFGDPLLSNMNKGRHNSLEDMLFYIHPEQLYKNGDISETELFKYHLAIKLLQEDTENGRSISLVHNDVAPGNILLNGRKGELVIIDPGPAYCHPYYCLARTIIAACLTVNRTAIEEGYQSISGNINRRMLEAAMVVRSVDKINAATQKKNLGRKEKMIVTLKESLRKINL